MGALLAFPRPRSCPDLAHQRERVAVRERQLDELKRRHAEELAIALARVEAERRALDALETSPARGAATNSTPGSPTKP